VGASALAVWVLESAGIDAVASSVTGVAAATASIAAAAAAAARSFWPGATPAHAAG
jgi:hypothetical protein